jgi:hypothetical protein
VEPLLSRVIFSQGMSMIASEYGLASRALRDITRGYDLGRFRIVDPFPAFLIAGGAALALGRAI